MLPLLGLTFMGLNKGRILKSNHLALWGSKPSTMEESWWAGFRIEWVWHSINPDGSWIAKVYKLTLSAICHCLVIGKNGHQASKPQRNVGSIRFITFLDACKTSQIDGDNFTIRYISRITEPYSNRGCLGVSLSLSSFLKKSWFWFSVFHSSKKCRESADFAQQWRRTILRQVFEKQ